MDNQANQSSTKGNGIRQRHKLRASLAFGRRHRTAADICYVTGVIRYRLLSCACNSTDFDIMVTEPSSLVIKEPLQKWPPKVHLHPEGESSSSISIKKHTQYLFETLSYSTFELCFQEKVCGPCNFILRAVGMMYGGEHRISPASSKFGRQKSSQILVLGLPFQGISFAEWLLYNLTFFDFHIKNRIYQDMANTEHTPKP